VAGSAVRDKRAPEDDNMQWGALHYACVALHSVRSSSHNAMHNALGPVCRFMEIIGDFA